MTRPVKRPGSGDVAVRGYEPADLEPCRALWVELTQWHRDIYDAPEIGGDDPGAAFDDHLSRVGAENVWVAVDGARVVGFVGMIRSERHAELEPLVVTESYRGHGVGRLLAATVIAAAQASGLRQLIVQPVARNSPAIRFFHDQGFDALGHLELILPLVDADRWIPGERIADRDFRF